MKRIHESEKWKASNSKVNRQIWVKNHTHSSAAYFVHLTQMHILKKKKSEITSMLLM